MARAASAPAAATAMGIVVLLATAGFRGAEGKSCTNAFSGLTSSHTERAAAQLRPATALQPVVHRHGHGHGHEQHLTPTDESTWMSLMPRRALRREEAFDWLMLYRKLRGGTATATAGGVAPRPGVAAGAFLSEASLHDVRLEPGSLYWRAQQTNLEYLLLLDVDRLVWSFRKQAGLTAPPGTPYGGWEGPDVELRGHFVGTPPDLSLASILEHLPRTTTVCS